MYLMCQMLAFPLSSYPTFPWTAEPMLGPVVSTLAVLAATDLTTSVALVTYVVSLAWLLVVVSLAVIVARGYTRDEHCNSTPVKVWSSRGERNWAQSLSADGLAKLKFKHPCRLRPCCTRL